MTQCSVPGYSYFAMCSEKSEHKLSYKLLVLASLFFILVQEEYRGSNTNILYLKILYIVVGVGKYMDAAVDIGSNPVSKHQIQPECGE